MDCIDQASSLQLLDSVHHLAFMRQVVPIEDLEKPNFYEASSERRSEMHRLPDHGDNGDRYDGR